MILAASVANNLLLFHSDCCFSGYHFAPSSVNTRNGKAMNVPEVKRSDIFAGSMVTGRDKLEARGLIHPNGFFLKEMVTTLTGRAKRHESCSDS